MTTVQWTPGASEAHTWIRPWTPDVVHALIADADRAGWACHIIDSDTAGKRIRDTPGDTTASLVSDPDHIDRLLTELASTAEARYTGDVTDASHTNTQILLAVGENSCLTRDARLILLARYGRAVDIHLAVDHAIALSPTSIELRDNILGVRSPSM